MEERSEGLKRIAVLAAAYFILGKLGLSLAFVHVSATAVWPATGLAVAACLMNGPRVWPGIFAGAFLVNVTTAGGATAAAAIALGNTLEGLLAAFLVARFGGGREALTRPAGILRFALLAAALSTAVSASVGAATLFLAGLAPARNLGPIWLTWWLGDAAGALIVAPVLLLWREGARLSWTARKILELAGLATAALLVSALVFGGLMPAGARNHPFDFLCLPVLIWAAFRFGPRETAAVSCAMSGLAVLGTLRGFGPFAEKSPNESLLLLQSFMAATSTVAITVAAAVTERRAADDALRAAHAQLEIRIQERTAELSRAVDALEGEILERRRMEEALQRSNTQLSLFASIAAHELQEPLRKLVTFGELVQTVDLPRGGEEKIYVQRMREAAQRMSRLIDDILNLSRVTTDAKPLESVELGGILGDLQADFEERLAAAGGVLTLGALPALRADAGQMRQLFGNLLSNAFKFRDKDRPTRIKVSSRRPRPGFVELSVEDNGIGFEPRYLDRIFKPFQRLHRRTDYEGSGMGLAICERIVMRHGGAITASSWPGRGSVFIVTLPG